jgi:hypothetical protein
MSLIISIDGAVVSISAIHPPSNLGGMRPEVFVDRCDSS